MIIKWLGSDLLERMQNMIKLTQIKSDDNDN